VDKERFQVKVNNEFEYLSNPKKGATIKLGLEKIMKSGIYEELD